MPLPAAILNAPVPPDTATSAVDSLVDALMLSPTPHWLRVRVGRSAAGERVEARLGGVEWALSPHTAMSAVRALREAGRALGLAGRPLAEPARRLRDAAVQARA